MGKRKPGLSRYSSIAAAAVMLAATQPRARAADEIDKLAAHTAMPTALRYQHAYSDFTDPLGRFLDCLAAGAFDEAKRLQPDACSSWRATRQTSAFTGKVLIWDTEIDLNTLCEAR
jgi:hypothetical protein